MAHCTFLLKRDAPCSDGDQLLTAAELNHEAEVINKVIFNKGNKSHFMQKSEQGTGSWGLQSSPLRHHSLCPEANYNLPNL